MAKNEFQNFNKLREYLARIKPEYPALNLSVDYSEIFLFELYLKVIDYINFYIEKQSKAKSLPTIYISEYYLDFLLSFEERLYRPAFLQFKDRVKIIKKDAERLIIDYKNFSLKKNIDLEKDRRYRTLLKALSEFPKTLKLNPELFREYYLRFKNLEKAYFSLNDYFLKQTAVAPRTRRERIREAYSISEQSYLLFINKIKSLAKRFRKLKIDIRFSELWPIELYLTLSKIEQTASKKLLPLVVQLKSELEKFVLVGAEWINSTLKSRLIKVKRELKQLSDERKLTSAVMAIFEEVKAIAKNVPRPSKKLFSVLQEYYEKIVLLINLVYKLEQEIKKIREGKKPIPAPIPAPIPEPISPPVTEPLEIKTDVIETATKRKTYSGAELNYYYRSYIFPEDVIISREELRDILTKLFSETLAHSPHKNREFKLKMYRVLLGISIEDNFVKKDVNLKKKRRELIDVYIKRAPKLLKEFVETVNNYLTEYFFDYKNINYIQLIDLFQAYKNYEDVNNIGTKLMNDMEKFVRKNLQRIRRTDGITYLSSSNNDEIESTIDELINSYNGLISRYMMAENKISISRITCVELAR